MFNYFFTTPQVQTPDGRDGAGFQQDDDQTSGGGEKSGGERNQAAAAHRDRPEPSASVEG